MANAVIRVTEVIRFVKDKEKPPPPGISSYNRKGKEEKPRTREIKEKSGEQESECIRTFSPCNQKSQFKLA